MIYFLETNCPKALTKFEFRKFKELSKNTIFNLKHACKTNHFNIFKTRHNLAKTTF